MRLQGVAGMDYVYYSEHKVMGVVRGRGGEKNM